MAQHARPDGLAQLHGGAGAGDGRHLRGPDDCAGGKAEPEDLLLLAKTFLQRCVSFRFYVNPAKFTIICNELAWLGRVLRDGKVLVDPSYVAGVMSCLRTAMTYGSPPRRIRVGRIREGSR